MRRAQLSNKRPYRIDAPNENYSKPSRDLQRGAKSIIIQFIQFLARLKITRPWVFHLFQYQAQSKDKLTMATTLSEPILTLMLGFERAIWISRRPKFANWWSGSIFFPMFFCRLLTSSFWNSIQLVVNRPNKRPGCLFDVWGPLLRMSVFL